MKDSGLSIIAVDDDEQLLGFLARAFAGARSFATFPSAAVFLAGARDLGEVIESLIFYADSRKEPGPRDCVTVDLCVVAREVGRELTAQAAAAGVTLAVTCPGGSAEVQGEREWIHNAVKRLVQNAIVFNKKNGRVELSVRLLPEFAAVTVTDSGIGIPPEVLSGLGNPFYQVADYLTRKTGGLGLGLAIIKRVAEAHKGGVTVASEPGRGTTFTVTFRRNHACAG